MKPKHHWVALATITVTLAGYASAASGEKYTYDASGNIVEKSIDGQVTKMTYDSSNRLTERQATDQSKETTAYDAAGRPIAIKDGTGQASRSMSYCYGDKVLETKNHGTSTGFFYNAEGQLVGKKSDSGVATYTWDGNVLAANGGETFTNEAHPTGGIPVMAGERDIVVSDFLGNTLSNGGQQYSSTAYGEGLELARFTGKAFVKELDRYVFHHRLYSADTSRWTVADPSGFPDGRNNFLYVKGDPLREYDPLGLATKVGDPVSSPNASDTEKDTAKQTTITSGGKIEYWAHVTETTTSVDYYAPKPVVVGVPGGSVSVSCSLEGETAGSWCVSGGYGPVSIGYTFGSGGTPSGSGSVTSPNAFRES